MEKDTIEMITTIISIVGMAIVFYVVLAIGYFLAKFLRQHLTWRDNEKKHIPPEWR